MSTTMQEKIEAYRARVRDLVKVEHLRTFQGAAVPVPEVVVTYGPRYALVAIRRESEKRQTVHSFIDLATGDIIEADLWKRPAKHRRGSVQDLDAGGFTSHGTWGVR